MLQWFVDTFQRLVSAAFEMVAALIAGVLRAPATAAARASASIRVRRAAPHEVVDVRHQVLREGRARDTAIFADDHAPDARHWVAVQADRVVGVVSIVPAAMPEKPDIKLQLRGMAVLPELRGEGIGVRLLEATHGLGEALWCNAREKAVGFYVRHGWHRIGEPFDIEGVGPHERMWWSPPTA